MNNFVHCAQNMGTSCHIQYVDADRAVLGRCMAGADGVWFVPNDWLRPIVLWFHCCFMHSAYDDYHDGLLTVLKSDC